MGFFDMVRRDEDVGPKPDIGKLRIEEEIHAKAVIDFTNPFSKQNMESVWMYIRKDYEGNIKFQGTVKYSAGSSSGEHKVEAESFQGLVDKINVCINNIGA